MKYHQMRLAQWTLALVSLAGLCLAEPQSAPAPTIPPATSPAKPKPTIPAVPPPSADVARDATLRKDEPTPPAQTCVSHGNTRFDPACVVRIFEDNGSGQRLLLYDANHPELNSRLLKADSESTLIIDLSKAFEGAANASLNNIFVKATLKKGNGSTPAEVIGYSTIGEASKDKPSQNAFAFQTFENVAGKLQDLYFTSKDIIQTVFPGPKDNDCYSALKASPKDAAKITSLCTVPAVAAESAPVMERFEKRLALFAPEADSLYEFFGKPENRGVTAQLATDIFEIDIEALQAIAQQIKDERTKIAAKETSDDAKQASLQRVLERIKLTVEDLGGVIRTTETIGKAYAAGTDGNVAASLQSVDAACHATLAGFGSGIAKASPEEFARRCYVEYVRPRYVEALKKFLVEGTISMAHNDASSGDVLTILVESKGLGDTLGIQAEWRIRVQDFAWKVGVKESLLFIKRIGVDEVTVNSPTPSPLAGVQPSRFLPFPGFTFGATYLGQRKGAVVQTKDVTPAPDGKDNVWKYANLPVSGKASLGRILQPGLGWNVTFMTFGTHRDFDPTANGGKGQFVTVTGSNFEIGTGPMLSLFNNRLLATYGWNLMQPVRREYWGLGFNFIQVGKDLAGFLKTK